jgi:hypothetical protein
MPSDLPGDDAKNVWLNQPTEVRAMTVKLIQQRSRDLRTRTRRKVLGTLAGPLAVGLFYAMGRQQFAALQPVLQPLFVFALGWGLVGLYFLNRGMWSAVTPEDVGISTGLEFCRREIERQRDLARRLLLWSLGPILLAIGAFILALAMVGTRDRGTFPNGLPFLAIVVIWIVAYFIFRWREQRDLRREIDELDDIEKEKHA